MSIKCFTNKFTCSFLIAEPSLLKYKSFAIALIFGDCVLRRTTFCLLPNELDDMEAKDDNLSEEAACFLSFTRPPGAAKEPTEDMVVKADAIYSCKTDNKFNIFSSSIIFTSKARNEKLKRQKKSNKSRNYSQVFIIKNANNPLPPTNNRLFDCYIPRTLSMLFYLIYPRI